MKLVQTFESEIEIIENEPVIMGYSEPCGEFIGHPSDPCDRCGFTYYRH